jgi:hypothetical protein
MYKKRGRHDKDAGSANTDEEQFATQFFNFIRKHSDIVISQVSVPQVNLDIDTTFTPNSVSSAPNNQKYPMYHIKQDTPCTLLYDKGRTLRTIKVVRCYCDAWSYNAWSAHLVRVCSGRSDHDQKMS